MTQKMHFVCLIAKGSGASILSSSICQKILRFQKLHLPLSMLGGLTQPNAKDDVKHGFSGATE
jgi:hypothetical protein